MTPKVSIVILNYNTATLLKELLPAVMQTTYPNTEIVVADNGSSDGSLQLLENEFPSIRTIKIERNLGFTGGYNYALNQVQCDYAVLLNSDAAPEPDWLQPMVEMAESDPVICAIQPKIRDYYKKQLFEYAGAAGGYIDKYGYPFCKGRLFDTLEGDNNQYNQSGEIFWATGAALFVRMSDWKQSGGLDEAFFAHMEEIDWCWRMKNRGKKVMYCHLSVVYHMGGGTLSAANARKTYYNFRNGLILLAKNAPKSTKTSTLIVRLLLDHIAAYRFLFKGQVSHFIAIAKAHFHFISKWGYWYKKAEVNIEKPNVTGLYNGMIILDYFLKKKNIFSSLNAEKFNQ